MLNKQDADLWLFLITNIQLTDYLPVWVSILTPLSDGTRFPPAPYHRKWGCGGFGKGCYWHLESFRTDRGTTTGSVVNSTVSVQTPALTVQSCAIGEEFVTMVNQEFCWTIRLLYKDWAKISYILREKWQISWASPSKIFFFATNFWGEICINFCKIFKQIWPYLLQTVIILWCRNFIWNYAMNHMKIGYKSKINKSIIQLLLLIIKFL